MKKICSEIRDVLVYVLFCIMNVLNAPKRCNVVLFIVLFVANLESAYISNFDVIVMLPGIIISIIILVGFCVQWHIRYVMFSNDCLTVHKKSHTINMCNGKKYHKEELVKRMMKDYDEAIDYAKKKHWDNVQFSTHKICGAEIIHKYLKIDKKEISDCIEKSKSSEYKGKEYVGNGFTIRYQGSKYNFLKIRNKDFKFKQVVAKQDYFKFSISAV